MAVVDRLLPGGWAAWILSGPLVNGTASNMFIRMLGQGFASGSTVGPQMVGLLPDVHMGVVPSRSLEGLLSGHLRVSLWAGLALDHGWEGLELSFKAALVSTSKSEVCRAWRHRWSCLLPGPLVNWTATWLVGEAGTVLGSPQEQISCHVPVPVVLMLFG